MVVENSSEDVDCMRQALSPSPSYPLRFTLAFFDDTTDLQFSFHHAPNPQHASSSLVSAFACLLPFQITTHVFTPNSQSLHQHPSSSTSRPNLHSPPAAPSSPNSS